MDNFVNIVERDGDSYVKMTVELPIQTYLKMKDYCYKYGRSYTKRIYYKELVNIALLKYMDRDC